MVSSSDITRYSNCVFGYHPDYASILGAYSAETIQPEVCFEYDILNDEYTNVITFEVNEEKEYWNEVIIYLTGISFAVLFGALYINFKSMSPNKFEWDWFKINILYFMGTAFLMPFFFISSEFGVTRVMGFGIIAHNAPEMYVVLFLWFGPKGLGLNNITSKNNELGLSSENFNKIILFWFSYVGLVSILLILLPANYVFLIGLFQGFILDAFFGLSFLYIGCFYSSQSNNYSKISFYIAAFGLLMHFISGLATAGFILQSFYPLLVGTLSFTCEFCTFTIFAIREHKRSKFCGFYDKKDFKIKYDNNNDHPDFVNNQCEIETEMTETQIEIIGDDDNNNIKNNKNIEMKKRKHTNDSASDDSKEKEDLHLERQLSFPTLSSTLTEKLDIGFVTITHFNKQYFIIMLTLSTFISLIYTLGIWYSPCFIPKDWMCRNY